MAKFQSQYTGQQIEDAITKAREMEETFTFEEKEKVDAIEEVFTAEEKEDVAKLNGIDIVTTLGTTNATIPTSKAVQDKLDALGAGDMTKAVYDTNNDGIVNQADLATNANKLSNKTVTTSISASDSYIPTSNAVKKYVDKREWTLLGTTTLTTRFSLPSDLMTAYKEIRVQIVVRKSGVYGSNSSDGLTDNIIIPLSEITYRTVATTITYYHHFLGGGQYAVGNPVGSNSTGYRVTLIENYNSGNPSFNYLTAYAYFGTTSQTGQTVNIYAR